VRPRPPATSLVSRRGGAPVSTPLTTSEASHEPQRQDVDQKGPPTLVDSDRRRRGDSHRWPNLQRREWCSGSAQFCRLRFKRNPSWTCWRDVTQHGDQAPDPFALRGDTDQAGARCARERCRQFGQVGSHPLAPDADSPSTLIGEVKSPRTAAGFSCQHALMQADAWRPGAMRNGAPGDVTAGNWCGINRNGSGHAPHISPLI